MRKKHVIINWEGIFKGLSFFSNIFFNNFFFVSFVCLFVCLSLFSFFISLFLSLFDSLILSFFLFFNVFFYNFICNFFCIHLIYLFIYLSKEWSIFSSYIYLNVYMQEWPSGLRRLFQVQFFSKSRVRIPPLAFWEVNCT